MTLKITITRQCQTKRETFLLRKLLISAGFEGFEFSSIVMKCQFLSVDKCSFQWRTSWESVAFMQCM